MSKKDSDDTVTCNSVREMTNKLLSIAGVYNPDHSKSKTNESSSEDEGNRQNLRPPKETHVDQIQSPLKPQVSPIKIQILRPKAHQPLI